MIYHVYYNCLTKLPANDYNLGNIKNEADVKLLGQDEKVMLARCIKESKGNSFVFIVTKDQRPSLEKYIDEHGLRGHLAFEMKQPITNGNYPDQGRKLWLYVFKTKE